MFLYPYDLEVIGWLILMKSWKEFLKTSMPQITPNLEYNVLYRYIELNLQISNILMMYFNILMST